MVAAAELTIDSSASAIGMALEMFGGGMTIVSASYSGFDGSSGIFTDGDAIAPNATPSDTGVILSTGYASDYTNSSGEANQSDKVWSKTDGVANDADLNAIAGDSTYDGAIFEATFVPVGETLTMQFVFSSEEYLEYVNAGFNDVVGIWVNGVQAQLTIGTGDISVDNINAGENQNLFIDNTGSAVNTEMDGLTITLTVKAPVNADVNNTIKIGIADTKDFRYDSNLLIAGNSLQSVAIAVDDEATVSANGTTEIDVLANDIWQDGVTLSVTHINGVSVGIGDSVTLSTGEIITLSGDGTLSAKADADIGSNVFSYGVIDSNGYSDVGFVNLTTAVPCFAAGSMIMTERGAKPVEDLRVGDLIETRGNGFQRLRWVSGYATACTGNHAPVVVEPNALGRHGRLIVSPQHRILFSGPIATLLFGVEDVLIRAKDVVNGNTIWCDESGAQIEYYHILFDTHQVVQTSGLWSESFQPGAQVLSGMPAAKQAELHKLLPASDASTGIAYGPDCYTTLRSYEARMYLEGYPAKALRAA